MNIAALKHGSEMASSETSGGAISTFDDIVLLSVSPITESNNWVQDRCCASASFMAMQ